MSDSEPWDARPWIVMFSATRWEGGAQRQHAMARVLGGDGGHHRVLFVEPPDLRVRRPTSVELVAPGVWRARPPTWAPLSRHLEPCNRLTRRGVAAYVRRYLDGHPGRRLAWIDEDLAWPAARAIGATEVLYDATDLDWTFTRSWNRAHLRRALQHSVSAADVVLTSSSALQSRIPLTRRPPIVVANACDSEHFSPDGDHDRRLDEFTRPIVGYVGAVDDRAFDADLLITVAGMRPNWTFVLAGPARRREVAKLASARNVHLLDAIPFEQTPPLMRGFDVGIIPYRVGPLVDYVHPKKFYEYLACGIPVVATPLPALIALDAPVRLARTAAEFGEAISAALDHDRTAAGVLARRRVAVENSWEARADVVRRIALGFADR